MIVLNRYTSGLFPLRKMKIHNVYSGKVASSVMASGAPNDHTGFGSRGMPENILSVCEDCNSTNFERDAKTGELTCIDCGLVIETLSYDDGPIVSKNSEEIAQNFRPTTKTNEELERKLKRYELFNKPKESLTIKMIKKGLKNFVSSEKEMEEAKRVLKAIKNSKTRLGKRSLQGYSPELTAIVVVVLLKKHVHGELITRSIIIEEVKKISEDSESAWHSENINDFSSLKDCTKKIYNIYQTLKNKNMSSRFKNSEAQKNDIEERIKFSRKMALESIIRGLKTQNQLVSDFSTNTDDLISDLCKSNRYPVRGSSLLRFSCEAVFQICRNRQIGLTREIIVQCTDELENKTKIDGWHDEIKSIIGEKKYE